MSDTLTAKAPGYQSTSHLPANKRKKVQGEGRGQPCTQQGLVVQTVAFSRSEYEERALKMDPARDKVWAPIGDMSCFQSMQGELAISAVDSFGTTLRVPTAHDAQIQATTTVNGWNKSDDAIFAGVVRNARPLSSADSAGVTVRVGTQTIINTGPDDIMANDIVYFSLAPYVYKDTLSGDMKPAIEIDEPGQPGYHDSTNSNGDYAPKFKPATYAIRDNSVYSFLRRADARLRLFRYNTGRTILNNITDAVKDAQVPYETVHAEDMPAIHYATFAALEKVLMSFLDCYLAGTILHKAVVDELADPAAWVKNLEDTFLKKYFDERKDLRKKYMQAIGMSSADAEVEWRPSKRTRYADALIPGMFSTVDNATASLYVIRYCTQLKTLLDQAKLEIVCEQHNYLRKRVIGKCVRGAAPGSGMDIALGYGHA